MSRYLNRRAVVLAVVALAGLSAAAYAFFTTNGTGQGTGSVGTSSTLTLYGTAATTLYPGTSSTVTFKVDNPSDGHQQLGTIHLDSVTTDAAHSGCVMTDFTMPDVVSNQDFAKGTNQSVTATGTLSMANTGVAQDDCKNAPLTLHLSS